MLSVCSASGAVLPATCYAKAMESHPTEGLQMSLHVFRRRFCADDRRSDKEDGGASCGSGCHHRRTAGDAQLSQDAKSFLLRLRGTSLQQACTDCVEAPVPGATSLLRPGQCKARELDEAADFEAKFLVLDTWPLPWSTCQESLSSHLDSLPTISRSYIQDSFFRWRDWNLEIHIKLSDLQVIAQPLRQIDTQAFARRLSADG